MADYYGKLRDLLEGLGYRPIPCEGKRPIISDWRNRAAPPASAFPSANVGILGDVNPALDVDIEDEEVQDEIRGLVAKLHPNALRRLGARSRALYAFTATEKLRKIRREYRHDESGRKGAVEILGAGQQWIAFGLHPQSGREYSWPDGRSIADVDILELESLDRRGAEALLDEIEGLLLRHGWSSAEAVASSKSSLVRRDQPLPEIPWQPCTEAEQRALEALLHLDAHDYGSWITAGIALKSEGMPFELWDAWSSTSPSNYDRNVCREKWDSFPVHGSTGLHNLWRAAGLPVEALDFEPIEGWSPTTAGAAEKPNPKIRTLADIAESTAPPWLIKGTIPQRSLVGLIAEPNVGKSFLLLDLAAAIERAAKGSDIHWFGRRVKAQENSAVVIFSYEGSMALRAKALRLRYPGVGDRIIVEHGWPNLRDPLSVSRVIERLKEIESESGLRISLIAFDTLNLALAGGNENSPEDMGSAVGSLKLLRDAFKTCVLVVHHLGKDTSKGARGHSSLLGALDTEITVTGDTKGAIKTRAVELTKIRDGDRTGPFGYFRLHVENLGLDEDGDEVTSCWVEPTVEESRKAEADSIVDPVADELLKLIPEDGASFNTLRGLVPVRHERLKAALELLLSRKQVIVAPGPRKSSLYRVAVEAPQGP